jgi:hypothetical protein
MMTYRYNMFHVSSIHVPWKTTKNILIFFYTKCTYQGLRFSIEFGASEGNQRAEILQFKPSEMAFSVILESQVLEVLSFYPNIYQRLLCKINVKKTQ